jgi:site-specific recombinase XerD
VSELSIFADGDRSYSYSPDSDTTSSPSLCLPDPVTDPALPPSERSLTLLLTDAVDTWLHYLKHHDGKTDQTRHDYLCHVRAYARFLGSDAVVADFSVHTARAFLADYARRCRPRSVRARLQSLRSFGAWCVTHELMTENPALLLKPPQMDEPDRRWPSDEKIGAVLAACERIADKRRAALTRALLSVCVYSGLRSHELVDLSVGDVDLTLGVLYVRHGKGDKPRTLYPHEACLTALREWLRLRPKDCQHDYLFALDRGRRVAKHALTNIFANVIAIAGFEGDRDLTPHCFRRAYATRLLRHGANLDEIRQAMGHSSVYTTGMYLYTSEAQMRRLAGLSGLSMEGTPAPLPTEKEGSVPVPKRPAWDYRRPASYLKRTSIRNG